MAKTPFWIGLSVGLLCAIVYVCGVFQNGSARITDRFFTSRPTDSSIVIVAIDDASLAQLGRWPWPRRVHAELIQKLSSAGARVIGYDVNFPEPSVKADDTFLADALRASGRVILPIEMTERGTVSPIALLSSAAAATGHTNFHADPDGIVRHVSPVIKQVPSFVLQVAHIAGIGDSLKQVPLENGLLRISFADRPGHAYTTLSAVDVFRGTADLSRLQNATVFVGATAADLHDTALVPTSNGMPMPGVEIHATAYETLVGGHWLTPLSPVAMAGLILLVAVLIGLCIPLLPSRWAFPFAFLLWAACLVAAFFAFDHGVIVDLVWPTLVIIFTFVAVTLERRLHADKRRKELKIAFSRYVSPVVVDSLVQHPEKLKLGGERKNMTVLFSDIRGFTTISEGEKPEKLVELLNTYLSRMTKVVFQHEGVLDKYIGDAVMAFWNAPVEHTDHAIRAVRAAVEMQRALAQMNASHAFGSHEIKIGIGINTGEMIVGNIGGVQRFEYTVIGDNVNVASRLEGLTKSHGVDILVSESTALAIAGHFTTRKIGEVAVKGKTTPTIIYEVVWNT